MEVVCFALQLVDPEQLIKYGGLWLLLLIVFSENGFFFGFFLPGDPLLFLAGMVCGLPILDLPVHQLILYIIVTAFLGYCLSYFIGYRLGKWLLNKPDSFFFKKKYVELATRYFEKNHQKAILAARFIPVIRSFLPLCLGIIHCDIKNFMIYNFLGAVLWTCSLVLAGYFLKATFPNIIHSLEWIIVTILIISLVPLVYQFIKHRKISVQS